jgi:hypothetical protein
MKRMRSIWFLTLTAAPVFGDCASFDDLPFATASSLPRVVTQRLGQAALADYKLSGHLNPYYLQADLDGDGQRDAAVLIKHKVSGKVGIAVFHAGRAAPMVLGAGKATGNGGDDFNWMDAWQIQERGPIERGAGEGAPPTLKGDAILVIKTEAASGLLYWTGIGYAWYQQGD